MRKGLIYCLVDPRDNLVKYIGQTISKLEKRYNQHLVDYKRRNCKVNSWIKSLITKDLKPIIEIIEDNIDEINLDKKEIAYIALYKSCGANLKNHNIGGSGNRGHKMTEEAKKKRAITNLTSEKMMEKHRNHSIFMKNKFKEISLNKPKKVEKIKYIISTNLSESIVNKFKTYKEASEYHRISEKYISEVCRNKRFSVKGFRFYLTTESC